MTDRPILFSGPMVCALLEGRKTQTRRALKPQPIGTPWFWVGDEVDPDPMWFDGYETGREPCGAADREVNEPMRLRYAPGDRLWVREAWSARVEFDATKPRNLPPHANHLFWADEHQPHGKLDKWGRKRPSMFMPRWMSRLTLHVTDVRVQRVQDISEADAQAEGVFERMTDPNVSGSMARYRFEALWNSLNAERGYGWGLNPWVVAISFTVEKRNIDAA